jgi:hypothetical protein
MRERARLDAEELVPRPDFQVLAVAVPRLQPAALAEFQQVNGEWESVTVAYGDWEAPAGPYLAVTTTAMRADAIRPFSRGSEAELLRAIDSERNRIADHAGVDDEEPADPPRCARSRLAFGDALICQHGSVWAARLLAADPPAAGITGPRVSVTITGRGVAPDSVRLEPAGDLRPCLEARNEILGRLAEHRRRQPPPVLEPAEGVAAVRALADYTLGSHTTHMAAMRAGRVVRHPPDWGAMWNALWQRAVREQQRIAGIDERAADDVVTLVINHLSHLAERAPWFTDARLREAAIDETLRHAVLGDDVPSLPAQQAWARYWSDRAPFRTAEPDAGWQADLLAGEPLQASWLQAWAAWAERANG